MERCSESGAKLQVIPQTGGVAQWEKSRLAYARSWVRSAILGMGKSQYHGTWFWGGCAQARGQR